jgi:hypothetical protein
MKNGDTTMLKLIVNNAVPLFRGLASKRSITEVAGSSTSVKTSPLFDCREIGENLYAFRGVDIVHNLALETTLEIKKSLTYSNTSEADCSFRSIISCQCPAIDTHRLDEIINGDEYLQGILVVLFQLRSLEELLLLCENKDVSSLHMNFNDINSDYLEIYRRFIVSEQEIITPEGEKTEVMISADLETYDALIDFMYELNQDFCQTLWRYQKANPAFRKYLKSHSLSIH